MSTQDAFQKPPAYQEPLPEQQIPQQVPQQLPQQFPPEAQPPQQQQQQLVLPLASLQFEPALVHCPHCNQDVVTKVDSKAGSATHLWALGFCCFICLPCIPYFVQSFKDQKHSCTACNADLAIRKRSGKTVVLTTPQPGLTTVEGKP